jgi:hypothetical protein
MATRCTIKIEGVDFAKIYKHYDGYPEGMEDWLNDFNSKFNKKRGHDPNYKFAQLLRFSQREGEKFGLDMSETTGWGVVPFDAFCWEEYEYLLTNEKIQIKTLNA